jgi:nitric oxide reductase activation protein
MQKDRIARKTAILFNEAFGSIPGVDLFIYGHTADFLENHSTQLNIYREPGMGIDRYSALSEIRALYENRDGDAILTAAKRVRKKTLSKCTMFVISDGSPCAYDYWGSEAVKDTRKKILQAQALDFNIIGICIDSVPEMDDMYDSWIDISSDLSQFPVKLGRIVKKTIMDSRSTVTS